MCVAAPTSCSLAVKFEVARPNSASGCLLSRGLNLNHMCLQLCCYDLCHVHMSEAPHAHLVQILTPVDPKPCCCAAVPCAVCCG